MSRPRRERDRDGDAAADVLFVSHEASRTGAPIVLLHLQRWLRRTHPNVQFETALLADGPLRADFEALGPVHLLGSERGWWPARTSVERGLDQIGWRDTADRLQRFRVSRRTRSLPVPPIVYLNTIVSTPVLRYLSGHPHLVVCHAHELASTRREGLRREDWGLLADRVDLVIAAAEPVRDVAVDEWGVSPERVTVCEEFVSVACLERLPGAEVAAKRSRFGIEPDAWVVGGAGTMAWRKGPDLFVQLAQRMPETLGGHRVHFVWAGEALLPIDRERLETDVERAGLSGRVHLVGEQQKPASIFAMADVLALTSREDPFPLVVLEHALLGVPVVCFEGAGGISHFVRRGGPGRERGFAVPYLDVQAMAEQVELLLGDPGLRHAVGRRAAAAVRDGHDVELSAPRLWGAVEQHAGTGVG